MKLLLLNTAQGLRPMYDEDYDEKKKLKIGQVYRADVVVPRNYGLHRKYFSLINCAWDLLTQAERDMYGNKDMFRKDVQMRSGYFDLMFCQELGVRVKVPRSISVDKMSGDEFNDLYRDVRDTLFHHYLQHISFDEFEEQLMNY